MNCEVNIFLIIRKADNRSRLEEYSNYDEQHFSVNCALSCYWESTQEKPEENIEALHPARPL